MHFILPSIQRSCESRLKEKAVYLVLTAEVGADGKTVDVETFYHKAYSFLFYCYWKLSAITKSVLSCEESVNSFIWK